MNIQFPKKTQFLFRPHRYKVLYGGRGSGKSWAAARALLIRGATESTRILCAREIQRSISDSVLRLLADQIDALGLDHLYDVQRTAIYSKVNDTAFIFEGLRHNVTKIKSMEGIDVVWVEEAEKVTDESWDVLIPTIRNEGSEIWVTFNPDLESDPTYQRFIVDPPPGAVVQQLLYSDNPWFPAELEAERQYLLRVDPERHAWIWEGQCRKHTEAQVLRGKWRVDSFEAGGWDGPYYGLDFGFSVDPTAAVRMWVHDECLYIDHELYKVGLALDRTGAALVESLPGADTHTIRADSARPETIHKLQTEGLRVVGAKKGKGSIEAGVELLRSFREIIIHPRCTHVIDEARLWSYKTDRLTGDVLPVLVDKHNHCWDAARYGLEPMLQNRQGPRIRSL